MSTTVTRVSVQKVDIRPINATHAFSAVGYTDPVQFSLGEMAAQITGTATAISLQLERSTIDPAGTPNWAPIGVPITGDLTAGVQTVGFKEVSGAWWRAHLTTLTGGLATVVLSGIGG